jgi:hypothetical protein
MGRILPLLGVGVQVVSAILAAVFVALDARDAGQLVIGDGSIDWVYLGVIALVAFAVFSVVEQSRLRYALSHEIRNRKTIKALTDLFDEGKALEASKPEPRVFVVNGPETEAEKEHFRQVDSFRRLQDQWGEKVRQKLQKHCPEYLADWQSTDRDQRQTLLLDMIRDIRGRLA